MKFGFLSSADSAGFVWPAFASIPLAPFGRVLAVAAPCLTLAFRQDFVRGAIPVLVWGGPRGGISVALALSIPEVAEKSTLPAATYTVVVFTIVVQGLSLKRLVQRVVG